MVKHFTLFCTSLLLAIQVGYAQTKSILGLAGDYSVLANTEVNNTGTTSVGGNLGIHPGDRINDPSKGLVVTGSEEVGPGSSAGGGQVAALQAYATLTARPITRTLGAEIGNRQILTPGVYHIPGNARLSNILILDGQRSFDSEFIFIIDGDFTSTSPASPGVSSAGVLPQNGAQAENIVWVVKGKADIGVSTLLMGSIVAQESVTLRSGASLIGSAISLNSSVSLNTNNIYLTTILYANLGVTKVAQPSENGFRVGDEVTYDITVRNSGVGSGTATNVRVKEQFPSTLQFVSARPSKGTYDPETSEWIVGNVQAESSATLSITFRILAAGSLVNNVQVISDTPDPDPEDDEAEDPIVVTCADPGLALTGNTAICPGVATLNFTATEVVGGTYAYEVTGGLSILSRQNNTVSLGVESGLTGGTLKVTVTDQCGETYSVTQNIGVLSGSTAPTLDGHETVCANSEVIFTATGAGADDVFNWVVTGGLQLIRSSGNTATVKAGNTGGTVSVTATNSCQLTSPPAIKTITTATPLAALGAINGPLAICAGTNEVVFSVPALTANTTYTWNYSGTWTKLGEDVVNGRARVRARFETVTTGDLTLTASNACGEVAATPVTVAVSSGAPAAPGSITTTGGACIGESIIYSIGAVANATSYEWTVTGAGWAIPGDNTGTSVTVTAGTGAGSIAVKAVNGCGSSTTTTLNVTPSGQLGVVGAIAGPATNCAGTTGLQYTIGAVTGVSTYTWSVPAGWTITAGQGTNRITVTAGSGNGAVRVAAANACKTTDATLNVTAVPQVAAPSIIDNSSVCGGLTYSVNPVAGATSYTWSVPNGFTITSGQGTASIQIRSDSPNAFGEVRLVTSNGACDGPTAAIAIDRSRIDGALEFPKAFSPNGDGINDTWVISNITQYQNQVTLFNRLGSEVYRKSNYQNDWNGNNLEAGTYFYRVTVRQCDNTNREYTGYVMIFR
ncbi:ice-binding family protein [Pontibacter sp. 13R65]|uniref:ice-binding family protein n=1 Tax=Pontibacter sp. 13R65 TaxID=3127458 RepID=UPI00301BD51D